MATHLKERTGEAETAEYDARIRHTVEDILADIESRGDAAVREHLYPGPHDR